MVDLSVFFLVVVGLWGRHDDGCTSSCSRSVLAEPYSEGQTDALSSATHIEHAEYCTTPTL